MLKTWKPKLKISVELWSQTFITNLILSSRIFIVECCTFKHLNLEIWEFYGDLAIISCLRKYDAPAMEKIISSD